MTREMTILARYMHTKNVNGRKHTDLRNAQALPSDDNQLAETVMCHTEQAQGEAFERLHHASQTEKM
jgi:hypothetical protein